MPVSLWEPMLTMLPDLRLYISRATAWVMKYTPLRLVSMMRS